ncbi:Protein of unknown function [Celeribacter indicus]|nr:Protein of unknown function [Celeribacter indicus]
MEMPISLVLSFVWAIVANVTAMLPSRRGHWPAAGVLVALGVPLVGFVTYEMGPWVGLAVLAAGASVLRWPIICLGRWLRR